MVAIGFILVCLAVAGAWSAWLYFRGDPVGTAHGLQQGEHAVPGAAVQARIKRRMDGAKLVEVELQLWALGLVTTFRLEPGDARALSKALEAAVAEMRSDR